MTKSKQLLAAALIIIGAAAVSFTGSRYVLASHKSAVTDNSHIVHLLSDHADPSAIAIPIGDYVQFNSADGKTHNIGQGKGDDEVHQAAGQDEHDHAAAGKESGDFGPKEGYKVQFNKSGTYDFHDHLNPKISVTVVVYEKTSKNL